MTLDQDELEERINTPPPYQTAPKRGRGRPKVRSDEDQKAIIIKSAMSLFVEQGYAATTMNDIAAECHVSKRTLYRLFPGKTELFAGMVEAHRHMMLRFPIQDLGQPIERQLEDIFLINVDAEFERQRVNFLQLALIESRQFPELGNIVKEHGADLAKQQLADWLGNAHRLGRIRIGDPLSAASILMDMIFGAVALKGGHGVEWPDMGNRRAHMRQCIQYFVNGVKNG